MALTPEEQKELQELEALEAQNALETEEVEDELTPEEEAELAQLEKVENIETSPGEAFARGAAQEVTFGLSDEIEAIADTAISFVKGDIPEDEPIGEEYNRNVDVVRKEYERAKDTHTSLYRGGQATGFAASIAVGGGIAKGVGKLAQGASKAASLAQKADKLLTVKSVAGAARLGAAQGALSGFGHGEGAQSLKDALVQGAGGAVIGAGAQKVLGGLAKSVANEKSISNKIMKGLGIKNPTAKRKFNATLAQRKQTPGQFIAELAEDKVAIINEKGALEFTDDTLIKSLNPEDVHTAVSGQIDTLMDARKPLLASIPVKNPSYVSSKVRAQLTKDFSPGDFRDTKLNKIVDDIMGTVDERLAITTQNTSKDGITQVSADISHLDLMQTRKAVDDSVTAAQHIAIAPAKVNELRMKASRALNQVIDEGVEAVEHLGGPAVNDKLIRSKLQSMYTVRNAIETARDHAQSPYSAAADMIQAVSVASVSGGVGGKAAAAGTVLALKKLSRSQHVNLELGVRLSKLSNIIESKGVDAGKYARRLAVAADLGPSFLGKKMESMLGEDVLAADPIQRNTEDVLNKSVALLGVAEDFAPEMASSLRDALESEDYEMIAPLMDQLSKQPELRKFFLAGKGFDGKVFDPEEKIQMAVELDGMDISHRQRLELKSNLLKNNAIPQVQQEEDPFIQHMKRNKKNPEF